MHTIVLWLLAAVVAWQLISALHHRLTQRRNINTTPINLTPRQAARKATVVPRFRVTPVAGATTAGSAQNNPQPAVPARQNRLIAALNRNRLYIVLKARWTRLPDAKKTRVVLLAIGIFALTAFLLNRTTHTPSGGTKNTQTSTKVPVVAEQLANAVVNSAIEVERTTDLQSYPYDDDSTPEDKIRYDPFNVGDDPTSKASAREAWVKITNQAPREFMNKHHNFERETLKEYVRLAVITQLQNGATVGDVINSWPTAIKGWKSDARIDDPAGWLYASEYSDSLRVTYLRSYEGRTYGLNVATKSLISPKMIAAKPRTRGDSLLAGILSLCLCFGWFYIIRFARNNDNKLLSSYDFWSLVPSAGTALLICWAAISRNVQPGQIYRSFHVWGWTVLIGLLVWSVVRYTYERYLPPIKKK